MRYMASLPSSKHFAKTQDANIEIQRIYGWTSFIKPCLSVTNMIGDFKNERLVFPSMSYQVVMLRHDNDDTATLSCRRWSSFSKCRASSSKTNTFKHLFCLGPGLIPSKMSVDQALKCAVPGKNLEPLICSNHGHVLAIVCLRPIQNTSCT